MNTEQEVPSLGVILLKRALEGAGSETRESLQKCTERRLKRQ